VGFFLYHFSVLSLGFLLPVYFVELLLFAWATGMMMLSLIFRFGIDVQALSWTLIYFVQPLGGIFYPISILPPSIRWFSYLLPTSYVFESIREQLFTGVLNGRFIIIALVLDIFYLCLGYFSLKMSFTRSKNNGRFVRLEG